MILKSKICGVSDSATLKYIVNHNYPPKFVGFITNYQKSKRFVPLEKLKELLKIDKKNSKYVSILVNPDDQILEQIKDLPFDYYQLYNCTPVRTETIKRKYNIKIITALTVENIDHINNYKLYKDIADIYLFDGKGYEKSVSFDHSLIKNINFDKEVMIAGNIKINENFENLKKIADIIDISGGLETSGLKDISKIETFLQKIKNLNYET